MVWTIRIVIVRKGTTVTLLRSCTLTQKGLLTPCSQMTIISRELSCRLREFTDRLVIGNEEDSLGDHVKVWKRGRSHNAKH